MMRVFRISLLLVLCGSNTAWAQTYRPTPGQVSEPFTEVVEPGAVCSSCQVLILDDAYPPPAHVNVYGPTVPIARKATADVLVYDRQTGRALLVVSSPYGAMAPYAAMGLYERVQWVTFRPNVIWAAGDLDGDGRTDLIGHDKETGDILRLYRRGWGAP